MLFGNLKDLATWSTPPIEAKAQATRLWWWLFMRSNGFCWVWLHGVPYISISLIFCALVMWHILRSGKLPFLGEDSSDQFSLKTIGHSLKFQRPIGSMVLLYMVTWIPSIYPSHVSIFLPAPWIHLGLVWMISRRKRGALASGSMDILCIGSVYISWPYGMNKIRGMGSFFR